MSRTRLLLAWTALLAGATAPGAAFAGQSATLTVSVRVVDRCTIEVPPARPPGLVWRETGRHPIAHACAGDTPARVRAAPHTPVAGGALPPGAARSAAARGKHVVVTVSY